MQLAIGIDVGFSASKRSTGVAIVDRSTGTIAAGTTPVVDTAARALQYVVAAVSSLQPTAVTVCVDGPFAAPAHGNIRLVEAFFNRGPFASRGGLRLNPAPTRPGSAFLTSTLAVVSALGNAGHRVTAFTGTALTGEVIEIFPTLYMGVLLPPHPYTGKRSDHSDALWETLAGRRALAGTAGAHRLFVRYSHLVAAVDSLPMRARHDARAAAVSAIAADLHAAAPAGSGLANASVYVGAPVEMGFVLPPRAYWDPTFLQLVQNHWQRQSSALAPLAWI